MLRKPPKCKREKSSQLNFPNKSANIMSRKTSSVSSWSMTRSMPGLEFNYTWLILISQHGCKRSLCALTSRPTNSCKRGYVMISDHKCFLSRILYTLLCQIWYERLSSRFLFSCGFKLLVLPHLFALLINEGNQRQATLDRSSRWWKHLTNREWRKKYGRMENSKALWLENHRKAISPCHAFCRQSHYTESIVSDYLTMILTWEHECIHAKVSCFISLGYAFTSRITHPLSNCVERSIHETRDLRSSSGWHFVLLHNFPTETLQPKKSKQANGMTKFFP